MNLMQLRYFLKTAELLNYSRAAEELLVARQSLRQSIAALEEELGKPLFSNVRNHLSLTEYGSYLAISGQEVIRAYDEMELGLQRLANSASRLNIGFSTTLDPFILPNTDVILRSFRAQFPDIQLTVTQMVNDEVIEAVMAGRLDAGFVLQMCCERPGCRMLRLQEFEVALDHSDPTVFGGKRNIEAEELRGVACLGMGELAVTMPPLWEVCRQRQIEFPYHVVYDTLDAFYQIKHTPTVGFDILKTDVPQFDWNRTTVLSGFTWEAGLLCSRQCSNSNLLTLFFRFMEQEYSKRREQYEQAYRSFATGFNEGEKP